jgi:mevalonate kinase
MEHKNPLFYGKVLLFGEYGIIKDSMGLSIPHTYYKGAFKFNTAPNATQSKSNEHLQAYLAYLKSPEAPCRFDFNAF